MQILITPKWYIRNSAEPAKVEASVYTAKYFNHPFVSLNISQPAPRAHALQPKLRIDLGPKEARELAAQLLRHAASVEADEQAAN